MNSAAWGKTATDRQCAKLSEQLKSSESKQRSAALSGLAALGSTVPCVVPVIAGALVDPEIDMRITASRKLDQFGPSAKAAVPALVKAIGQKDDPAHFEYVFALASIDDPAWPSVPLYIEALQDELLRPSAIEALGKLGPRAKAAIPELIKILQLKTHNQCLFSTYSSHYGTFHEYFENCAEFAAIALGQIGPDAASAVPTLIELMNSPYPYLASSPRDLGKQVTAHDKMRATNMEEMRQHVDKVVTALLRIHTSEALKAVEQYQKSVSVKPK